MSNEQPKPKRHLWLVLATLVVVAPVAYVWRGDIGCMAYPECNPLISVPATPDWNVPTNPHEKKMYDLAHSLKLPDGVAEPVPFDFKAARLKDLYGERSVAQQYFEHLCATESRDYVFKRIPNVDGFQIMRPRPETMDTPQDFDRYGVEEPVGFGWQNDDDQLTDGGKFEIDLLASDYIQPLNGVYRFVEYVESASPNRFIRVERALTARSKEAKFGIEANWRTHSSGALRVPYLKSRREVDRLSGTFGYAWRGLRRIRDREFGVGGGDFVVFEIATQTVVGLRRTFNSTFVPGRPEFTKWSAARNCPDRLSGTPIPNFVQRVLNPDIHVNDEFVPASELSNYHHYIERKTEHGYANN